MADLVRPAEPGPDTSAWEATGEKRRNPPGAATTQASDARQGDRHGGFLGADGVTGLPWTSS